ncbi:MAG: dimethyl sulfoxide reductase anchor subunit [Acidobacteriia bacterium]|nr:dimethyl sulfoxide reductase anchor subunit [Terriglobia bacterium]
MTEWPLVVFTIAIQLAGGLVLAATLFDRTAPQSDAVMRPLGMAIFPLAMLGLLASLLHLGRPLAAWKSLLNLGSSRLSLEVLLTLLFVLGALIYSHAWWAHKAEHRFALGIVTSLLALAAVASSSVIYLFPTQPAWNSGWVPVSFLGTALLLGGCAASVLVNPQGPRSLLRCFLAGGITGSLLLFLSAMWMIANLSRTSLDDFGSARLQGALHLVTSRYPLWLGLHLLLAGVVPIAFASLLWNGRNYAESSGSSWIRVLFFLAAFLGAVIGRRLMYLLGVSLPQF